jgi:hypothetical protein
MAGLVPLLLFAIAVAMATGLASGGESSPSAVQGTAVTIYVTNEESNSIAIYPPGSSGLASPVTISGAQTQLSFPLGLFVDSLGDIYVANALGPGLNGPSVTEYGSTATGPAAPIAVILGSNTNLAVPFGVALDPSGNIYVTNRSSSSNSITEYVAGANNDIAPVSTISGPLTRLTQPSGIAIDRSGNIYAANYLASTQSSTVTEFAPNSNGNAPPAALISGALTGLNDPVGIALDSSGNIYVSNIGSSTGGVDSITEYTAGSNGNMAPIATISGAETGLSQPYGVAVDQFGNIYAANSAANTVTEYAAGSNGDAPPIVTLSGAFSVPRGIAVAASNATPGPSATPTPTPTPTATPTAGPTPIGLSVSTASITFPVTGTGTKSTPVALTIGNSGSVTLMVNVDASAVMETGAFKVTGAGSFKLPRGHTKAIKVTFAPSSAGTFGGNMSIAANNSSTPVTVMVTGAAQSGTLSAPATLSFGSVAVHHSQTQTLTIQNTGLGVLKGRVVASGLKKPFQLLSGGGAFTLSTEKMRAVKVKFAPASGTPSGTPFTGTIAITSDDPANMSQSVTVSGNGT